MYCLNGSKWIQYGTKNTDGETRFWTDCEWDCHNPTCMELVSEISDVPVAIVRQLVDRAVKAHKNGQHGVEILSPPYGLPIEATYGQGSGVQVIIKDVPAYNTTIQKETS